MKRSAPSGSAAPAATNAGGLWNSGGGSGGSPSGDGLVLDGYDNDRTLVDESQSELSIHNFLDCLDLLQYFPLFSGYDSVTSLCVLSEADLVRIGVVNARHRRNMRERLERDFGAPSPQQRKSIVRAGSQASVVVPPALLVPKKKGFKGRFPLKAFERHSIFTASGTSAAAAAVARKSSSTSPRDTPSPSPRGSVDSAAVAEVLQDPQALLQHQPWFHGKINRRVAEAACRNDGDVLLRESTSKPGQYVLTTRWKGKPVHFVVDTVQRCAGGGKQSGKSGTLRKRSISRSSMDSFLDGDGGGPGEAWYRFGNEAFPSIVELVNHHLLTKSPISDANGPVAHYALPRHLTRSADDRSSIATDRTSLGSRRNSLRLEDLETLSMIDMPLRDTKMSAPRSPGGDSAGAVSLPARRGAESSPPTKQKTSVFAVIRRKSPLRSRRHQGDADLHGSASSLNRPSGSSAASLSRATSLESLRNPDLPDRDFLKSVCSVVLQNSANDLARHIARIDLVTAHILLPKELAPADSAFLPLLNGATLRLSADNVEEVVTMQAEWHAGGASGLAAVLLQQGDNLVQKLLQRFESLSRWTAIIVLGAGDLLHRCSALRKLTEIAQALQSDAVADLFGFMAVMHGLRRREVRRLDATWAEFRLADGKVAMLYESQLCGLDLALRQGTNTHQHIPVSVPPIQPLLELVGRPMAALDAEDMSPPPHDWFPEDDVVASLDATLAHMDRARELALQHAAYSMAAAARFRHVQCIQALEEYCRRDFPSMLLASRTGLHMASREDERKLMLEMMDALTELAEPSNVIGRNTAI